MTEGDTTCPRAVTCPPRVSGGCASHRSALDEYKARLPGRTEGGSLSDSPAGLARVLPASTTPQPQGPGSRASPRLFSPLFLHPGRGFSSSPSPQGTLGGRIEGHTGHVVSLLKASVALMLPK